MLLNAITEWLVIAAFACLTGGAQHQTRAANHSHDDSATPLARCMPAAAAIASLAALGMSLAQSADARQPWVTAIRLALLGAVGLLVGRRRAMGGAAMLAVVFALVLVESVRKYASASHRACAPFTGRGNAGAYAPLRSGRWLATYRGLRRATA